jgi:ketosteroid isomerase-like protein
MIYRALVRRRVRATLDAVSRGDYTVALERADEDVIHSFPGGGPLGGSRRGRAQLERWFERLFRLCRPSFDEVRIVCGGPPWDTWVAAYWVATVAPAAGPRYENRGTQWLRLRWGRVTEIQEHLGTDEADAAIRVMLDRGITEACAAPIED